MPLFFLIGKKGFLFRLQIRKFEVIVLGFPLPARILKIRLISNHETGRSVWHGGGEKRGPGDVRARSCLLGGQVATGA